MSAARTTRQQLLAHACERNERVRLRLLAAHDDDHTVFTRLLACTDEHLIVFWPSEGGIEMAGRGLSVEVFFEHDGEHYALVVETVGRVRYQLNDRTTTIALRLTAPTAIEHRQQREAFRVSVNDLPPIHTTLTVEDEQKVDIRGRVTNISSSGMAISILWRDVRGIRLREVFRVRFSLPDIDYEFNLAAEVMHVRRHKDGQGATLGVRYCPLEDPQPNAENTRQLERFVAERQQVQLRRAREKGRLGR